MSPLELKILLHYYAAADDFRGGDFSAPAVREAIDWFKGSGQLLEEETDRHRNRTYKMTERGKVFVDALCKTPLPEQRWVMS